MGSNPERQEPLGLVHLTVSTEKKSEGCFTITRGTGDAAPEVLFGEQLGDISTQSPIRRLGGNITTKYLPLYLNGYIPVIGHTESHGTITGSTTVDTDTTTGNLSRLQSIDEEVA